MTYKDGMIYILGKFGEKTLNEIVSLFYENFPEKIEYQRERLRRAAVDKTEKELFYYMSAYLSSYTSPRNDPNGIFEKNRSTGGRMSYFLTEEGKSEYANIVLDMKKDDDVDVSDINNDLEDVDNIDSASFEKNIGIIYLLISKPYPNTYKIGQTLNLKVRLDDLNEHPIYGLFELEPKMYFECNNYILIERVLHRFFEDFRMGKGLKKIWDEDREEYVSSARELFRDNSTIEEEFKLFYKMLSDNPRYKNIIGKLKYKL